MLRPKWGLGANDETKSYLLDVLFASSTGDVLIEGSQEGFHLYEWYKRLGIKITLEAPRATQTWCF